MILIREADVKTPQMPLIELLFHLGRIFGNHERVIKGAGADSGPLKAENLRMV